MFLGDFVEYMAATLQKDEVRMPFENERPWHELFYDLKKTPEPGKPVFFSDLRFDWDGPYPKCSELSEFLHALHWNACVDARNPHFDTISLPKNIADLWSNRAGEIASEEKVFLSSAAAKAKSLFGAVKS